jgi:hypothetical protein
MRTPGSQSCHGAAPGSPSAVFDLPPDEIGTRSQAWLFSSIKRIGSALDDLTKQEAGPDFAFDAARDSSGLGLRYVMRHGSEANPRIGTAAGIWSLGNDSPLIGFKATDAIAAGASAAWCPAFPPLAAGISGAGQAGGV